MRVLHVDDEVNTLRTTKILLEEVEPQIQVVSVENPREALKLLSTEAFDCVVSDYQMPGMDGIEFCRRVKEISQLPYILYTGWGSEEVGSKAFAAGVDDYVRKEFDPSHYQVLARRIKVTVEMQRVEERLRALEKRFRETLDSMRGAAR